MPRHDQHPDHRVVAVVALLDQHNRMLMVRTRRLPDYWQPVGGGQTDQDTSLRSTVAREVREELGLRLAPEAFTHQLRTPYDFGDGEVHFYTARLPPAPKLEVNEREILECRWVPIEVAQGLDAYPATRRFLQHLATQHPQEHRRPRRRTVGTSGQQTA